MISEIQKLEGSIHIFRYEKVKPEEHFSRDPLVQHVVYTNVPFVTPEAKTVIRINDKFYLAGSIEIHLAGGKELPHFAFTNLTEFEDEGLLEYAESLSDLPPSDNRLQVTDNVPELEAVESVDNEVKLTRGYDINSIKIGNQNIDNATELYISGSPGKVLYGEIKIGIADIDLKLSHVQVDNIIEIREELTYKDFFGAPPPEKVEDLKRRLQKVEEILIENGVEYQSL